MAVDEAEWLACRDPGERLQLLRGEVSDRKLRLYACACCRRAWRPTPVGAARHAVEAAERFADGEASAADLDAARGAAAIAAASAARALGATDPPGAGAAA